MRIGGGGVKPNILLITLDQFRGDSLSVAGHPLVRTPHLDDLAAHGVRFARHYSQTAPCGPGRASLYTGTYQMNHRVVGNGTPLDARFDNVALVARRAGYEPALFGYTDTAVDPRVASGPDDPRLLDYEGVLPGFDEQLTLVRDQRPWREWLDACGYDIPDSTEQLFTSESSRPAEVSISAFLTDRAIEWIDRRDAPWFAHLSYLRPHPPYAAAGHYSTMYDPADVPAPLAPAPHRHPLHDGLMNVPELAAPQRPDEMSALRAQYFGMISEVDHQLGRLWDHLRSSGCWDDTVVIVTSDHGEQAGDHGYLQKAGFFEQSYHIPGIVRDPRHPGAHGTAVTAFTENIDVLPTLCEAIGIEVPAQCDGFALTPFVRGETPERWRTAAHWEFDWRTTFITDRTAAPTWDRRLARQHLAVLRDDTAAYVQFGNGTWRCFDLAADPTWRTETDDPEIAFGRARAMLQWRSVHTDRTLSDAVIDHGVLGRPPSGAPPTR